MIELHKTDILTLFVFLDNYIEDKQVLMKIIEDLEKLIN